MNSNFYNIRLDKAIENKWLYYVYDYTLNDFKKKFEIESTSLFGTTHTKKIATSINNHFLNKLSHYSKTYFNYLFQPTNNSQIISKREEIFKQITNLDYNYEDFLENINNIMPLKYKSTPYVQAYTTSSKIRDYFLNNYNLSLLLISEEEAEEISEQSPDAIYVGDNYLMCFDYELKTNEFENFIIGYIFSEEKQSIYDIIYLVRENKDFFKNYLNFYNEFFSKNFNIDDSSLDILNYLSEDKSTYKKTKDFVDDLGEKVEGLNNKISTDLKNKTLSIEGEEVVALLEKKTTSSLQEKISQSYSQDINELNDFIDLTLKSIGFSKKFVLKSNQYPFEIDEEEINSIIEEASFKGEENKRKKYQELGSFMGLDYVDELFSYTYFLELIINLKKEFIEENYSFVSHNDELNLSDLRHFFIDNPTPISYSLGGFQCVGKSLQGERVSLVTGANSGGKTTMVESIIQGSILSSMGFPVKASINSTIPYFNKITYLKKFTGTQGSGAFEQTLKQLLELLEDTDSNQLIIIDELEAVTEPGAAANILMLFLKELAKQNKYAIAISHLGEELESLLNKEEIKSIRIDGISAEGLDDKGRLITNHQPHFYSRGKSTPELIMKRVLLDDKFWSNKSQETKEIFESLIDK